MSEEMDISVHYALEAEITRLTRRLSLAAEVIRPFAEEGKLWLTEADSCIADSDPLNEHVKDSEGWLEDLTVGDLRKARAWVAAGEE